MEYSTGAEKSKYDIRTFSYVPTKANLIGGTKYLPEDIENQFRVGICTAIGLTQNARKALGIKFSADFQYLLQKKFLDKNWIEGSSIFSALSVAKNYGLLPEDKWTFTTEQDRLLSYGQYIKKLQAISDADIQKLLDIAKDYKISAYAQVPVNRDMIANAIDESKAGILCRFEVGTEWWTQPVEPIRPPAQVISGHAVTECNYSGNSGRIANSWGKDWADGGTAYFLMNNYKPTEAWIPYYAELPKPIEDQKQKRATIIGQIMDYLQKIIALLPLLI
jgi:hypothetical protein